MDSTFKGCPKCGAMSGNSWKQCKDWCPMGAPHLPTDPPENSNPDKLDKEIWNAAIEAAAEYIVKDLRSVSAAFHAAKIRKLKK